jgi:hypothetical protein
MGSELAKVVPCDGRLRCNPRSARYVGMDKPEDEYNEKPYGPARQMDVTHQRAGLKDHEA